MVVLIPDLRPGTSVARVKQLYEYGMISRPKMEEYIKDSEAMQNRDDYSDSPDVRYMETIVKLQGVEL